MKLYLLLYVVWMSQSCVKGSGSKGEFRANVQDNRTVADKTSTSANDTGENNFDIELVKEKEKLKEVILRSSHKAKVKEDAIQYIDNFDYSRVKSMRDFMDIFLVGLMEILPDGLKDSMDVAVDSTIIAANTPISEETTRIVGLKQDILKEVIKRTAIQKSISEDDIRSVISESVEKSGFWEVQNSESVIVQIKNEILNEPEVIEALSTKAVKLQMQDCVDPDLNRIPTDQSLTLCDGTQVNGKFVLPIAPKVCDQPGETNCLTDDDYIAIEKATCVEPNLNVIKQGISVVTCDGTIKSGLMPECQENGAESCITNSIYKSADLTNLDAENIRQGLMIAGITGNLIPKASNCTASREEGCTTTSEFSAFDFDLLLPSLIKNGSSIASIDGDYPSESNPLPAGSGVEPTTYTVCKGTSAISPSGSIVEGLKPCDIPVQDFAVFFSNNLNTTSTWSVTATEGGLGSMLTICETKHPVLMLLLRLQTTI